MYHGRVGGREGGWVYRVVYPGCVGERHIQGGVYPPWEAGEAYREVYTTLGRPGRPLFPVIPGFVGRPRDLNSLLFPGFRRPRSLNSLLFPVIPGFPEASRPLYSLLFPGFRGLEASIFLVIPGYSPGLGPWAHGPEPSALRQGPEPLLTN